MKSDNFPYQRTAIREHLLRSRFVAQTFRITVLTPIRRTDDSEQFPVLYVTDADACLGGVATMAKELQLVGETPRFILVGIGYEDARAADLLRMRDFFTHAIRAPFQRLVEQLADVPFATGVPDLKAITQTTDARDFLNFIRDELMPFIDEHYPVIPSDNHYSGYSAGATFGLYTLFTRPETFKRYILGSPATSFGSRHFGIELAKSVVDSRQRLDAKVFISVGELEEFYADFNLTTGYYLLAKFLKDAAIPGLDFTARVFPGETHATAWMPAFTQGLKTLFGHADHVPFWPDFRQK